MKISFLKTEEKNNKFLKKNQKWSKITRKKEEEKKLLLKYQIILTFSVKIQQQKLSCLCPWFDMESPRWYIKLSN